MLIAKGDLEGALSNFRKSFSVSAEIGDKRCIAAGYHNLGTYFERIRDYNTSLKNLFLSLALQNQVGIKEPETIEYILKFRKSIGLNLFKDLTKYAFDNLPEDLKPFIALDDFIKEETVHHETTPPVATLPAHAAAGRNTRSAVGSN